MKSSIRPRVLKGNSVEVNMPRLLEIDDSAFQPLSVHLPIVKEPEWSENESNLKVAAHDHEAFNLLATAEAEAAQIVSRAQAEAEKMIAETQAETVEIRSRTLVEMEALKDKIRGETAKEAYTEGYNQGSEQGLAEGKQRGRDDAEQLVQEAQKMLELARSVLAEEYRRVDQALLHLSIKIAEQILRASLKIDPSLLVERISALISIPQEREGMKLHVSAQDAEWLAGAPEMKKFNIVLLRDDGLQPGDCYLESREGILDAHIDSQLTRFEELLGEELRNGRLE